MANDIKVYDYSELVLKPNPLLCISEFGEKEHDLINAVIQNLQNKLFREDSLINLENMLTECLSIDGVIDPEKLIEIDNRDVLIYHFSEPLLKQTVNLKRASKQAEIEEIFTSIQSKVIKFNNIRMKELDEAGKVVTRTKSYSDSLFHGIVIPSPTNHNYYNARLMQVDKTPPPYSIVL